MDASSVLRAHIAVALDDVRTADNMLRHPKVPRSVQAAALERLEEAFRSRTSELESLYGDVSGGASLDEGWRRLKSIRTDVEASLQESLASLGGLLLRQNGMDDEFSSVVDALLGELATVAPMKVEWPSVTIAIGDAFSPLDGTVRTRYPEFSIWALPIIAHEAGHVLVQEIRSLSEDARSQSFPLVELAGAAANDLQDGSEAMGERHMRELFADYLGVWTLGAAFACSAILLRFIPATADQAVSRHPPEILRTYVVLWALRRVDPGYDDVVGILERLWSELLVPIGLQPISGTKAARLDKRLTELAAQVDHLLSKARYGGRENAQKLVEPLCAGEVRLSTVVANTTIRDVVNAAWIARLRNWDNPAVTKLVGESALTACRQIAANSGAGATEDG